MSFLFGRQQPSSAEKIAMLEVELEATTDMMSRVTDTCFRKCITNTSYPEGDLSKGESVCLDRCVAKFMDTAQFLQKKAQEQNSVQATSFGS